MWYIDIGNIKYRFYVVSKNVFRDKECIGKHDLYIEIYSKLKVNYDIRKLSINWLLDNNFISEKECIAGLI